MTSYHSKNLWRSERFAVTNSRNYTEYVITISANVAVKGQGDIAVDDIVFSPECKLKNSETTPASSTNAPCDAGKDRKRIFRTVDPTSRILSTASQAVGGGAFSAKTF